MDLQQSELDKFDDHQQAVIREVSEVVGRIRFSIKDILLKAHAHGLKSVVSFEIKFAQAETKKPSEQKQSAGVSTTN